MRLIFESVDSILDFPHSLNTYKKTWKEEFVLIFFPTTELGHLIPSSPNFRLGFTTPLAPLAFKSSDLNRNFTTS